MYDLSKIARAVYDVEEATAAAFEIIVEHKVEAVSPLLLRVFWYLAIFCIDLTHLLYVCPQMVKSNARASLIKFLQILVAHHPSKR